MSHPQRFLCSNMGIVSKWVIISVLLCHFDPKLSPYCALVSILPSGYMKPQGNTFSLLGKPIVWAQFSPPDMAFPLNFAPLRPSAPLENIF